MKKSAFAERKIPVKVTMSRVSSNTEEDFVSLTVTDQCSFIQFLDLKIPLKEFALFVTGMGYVPCEAEVRRLDLVGRQHEVKSQSLPLPKAFHHREWPAVYEKMIQGHEVDGWQADGCRSYNHHNVHRKPDGTETYSVTFRRYLPLPEEP